MKILGSPGIITQARMSSTRLPEKVMKRVKGKAILEYHIERLLQSGYPVFIATTVNEVDDIVVKFAEDHGIGYYRGDEDNVLKRYYECASKFSLDVITRVTSDCPLVDGSIIKQSIDRYLELQDTQVYLSNYIERTFPRGFDFEVFSFRLLETAYNNANEDFDKEHVTPYIRKDRSVIFQHVTRKEDKSNYRITLDTAEDFELISKLMGEYSCENKTAEEIIRVLDLHPELVSINSHIQQK